MLETKFSEPSEFIEELTKDAGERSVAGNIVRLTVKGTMDNFMMRTYSVIGTYLRQTPGTRWITILNARCGSQAPVGDDHTAPDRANDLICRLTAQCQGIGLDVRAGYFEDDRR